VTENIGIRGVCKGVTLVRVVTFIQYSLVVVKIVTWNRYKTVAINERTTFTAVTVSKKRVDNTNYVDLTAAYSLKESRVTSIF